MKGKVKRIILRSLIGVAILTIGIKINHEIRLILENSKLQTAIEASQMVAMKDGRIHAVTRETSKAEDTIVFLHGLGMGDTTITANAILTKLETAHNVFLMDRYGNGLSDDSDEAQIVDAIVDLYRSVLRQTEQKAPYILIAHSISGIYATYWAQQYPEEIKAIIYLDADPVECYEQEGKIDKLSLLIGKAEVLLTDMGVQRIFISDEALLGDTEHQAYTEEENRFRKYLMYQNTMSKATCSELEWYYENAQTVLAGDMNLCIPQLYLVANNVQGEYYDKVYASTLYERYNGDEEQIREKIDSRLQLIEEKKRYRSKAQNMQIVEISGPHCLYEYNPEGIIIEITDFLK